MADFWAWVFVGVAGGTLLGWRSRPHRRMRSLYELGVNLGFSLYFAGFGLFFGLTLGYLAIR